MEVTGAAGRPSARGPAEWFTGEVWQDEIASLPDPGLARALRVHFMPGARPPHVHTSGANRGGLGRVQGERPGRSRPDDDLVPGRALSRDEDYRAAPGQEAT